jgi:hypothetical protein
MRKGACLVRTGWLFVGMTALGVVFIRGLSAPAGVIRGLGFVGVGMLVFAMLLLLLLVMRFSLANFSPFSSKVSDSIR